MFVQLKEISTVCNDIGIGANREPEQVANISMLARVFLTAMILYDVGVSNVASRHDLHNNYINILTELQMFNEAEDVTQHKTDSLLEELYEGGIVAAGGHCVFGRHKCFNRDSNPHKVCYINVDAFKNHHVNNVAYYLYIARIQINDNANQCNAMSMY